MNIIVEVKTSSVVENYKDAAEKYDNDAPYWPSSGIAQLIKDLSRPDPYMVNQINPKIQQSCEGLKGLFHPTAMTIDVPAPSSPPPTELHLSQDGTCDPDERKHRLTGPKKKI